MRYATSRGLPAVLVCLALGTGCGDRPPAPAVASRDSAGIRIVDAPGADVPLPWTLTEFRRLGGADSGAAAFSGADPQTVGVDSLGRIYVLDTGAHRVAVFDSSGTVLRVMGRQGGGPGEMQFPGVISVAADGTVDVLDYGKSAIVRFGPAGEILPQVPLTGGFPQGQVLHQGDTLLAIFADYEEHETVLRFSVATPRDTASLMSLSFPTPGMTRFNCVGLNMPRVFTPRLVMGGWGHLAAVARQTPYEVNLFRDGRLAGSVRREIPPEPGNTAALERQYPEGMTLRFGSGGGGKCVITVSELQEKLGVADVVPQIRAVTITADGTLWVKRYTFPDEPERTDVFAGDGAYLGTLTGRGLPLGTIGRDVLLFVLEEEDTGAKVVGMFRVTR
ncbi:MAG: 6-bladed beta-propeller [Gemmatimonadales bacterium]